MRVSIRWRKSRRVAVVVGALASLGGPLTVRGDEWAPRLGLMLGGSLLSRDEYARMPGGSRTATMGASLLVGTTVDLPLWDPRSRMSFELAYGPFHRDASGVCHTASYPVRTECFTSRATAGTALAGIQIDHAIGRGTVRPWVAVGTGMTLTWFKPDEFEPMGPTTSQTIHVAAGFVTRRLRLELRGLVVFQHPHPHPRPDSGDTRKALQVRLTLLPFAG